MLCGFVLLLPQVKWNILESWKSVTLFQTNPQRLLRALWSLQTRRTGPLGWLCYVKFHVWKKALSIVLGNRISLSFFSLCICGKAYTEPAVKAKRHFGINILYSEKSRNRKKLLSLCTGEEGRREARMYSFVKHQQYIKKKKKYC